MFKSSLRTRHAVIRGSRGVSPLIININTRWNWLASLKLRSLYSLWKNYRYRLNMSLSGTRNGLDFRRSAFCPFRKSNPGRASPQRSRYTDYAVPTPIVSYFVMFLRKTEINVRTESCIFGLCNTVGLVGARGGALYWGTALQAGRSSFLFPIMPLAFFIDIILPVTLWPWGRLSL